MALIAVVAALTAAAPDAGFQDELYATCPTSSELPQLTDGGWLLSPSRAARAACLLQTCDERRLELEEKPVLATWSRWSLYIAGVAAVLGVLLGGYLGWELRGFLRP